MQFLSKAHTYILYNIYVQLYTPALLLVNENPLFFSRNIKITMSSIFSTPITNRKRFLPNNETKTCACVFATEILRHFSPNIFSETKARQRHKQISKRCLLKEFLVAELFLVVVKIFDVSFLRHISKVN